MTWLPVEGAEIGPMTILVALLNTGFAYWAGAWVAFGVGEAVGWADGSVLGAVLGAGDALAVIAGVLSPNCTAGMSVAHPERAAVRRAVIKERRGIEAFLSCESEGYNAQTLSKYTHFVKILV
ncbi:MAG: hypothetical protein Q7S47_00090 [bacterium]|nr:hypothetical protein [bacterium]